MTIPPGDLARRAEEACRDDAVENVWLGVFGLALVAVGGGVLVGGHGVIGPRRANEPGDSCDRMVPDVSLLKNGTFARPD